MAKTKKSRKKKISSLKKFTRIMVFTVIALLLVYCAIQIYLWRSRPNIVVNTELYPIVGIDISKHNGKINFSQVAESGISFVYMKATEGEDFRDICFNGYYEDAVEVGLEVGAYHFFRLSKNGAAQARNFLAAVANKEIRLPLVIDVEDWGNDLLVDSREAIRNLALMVMCLKSAGKKVMLYTNQDGYKKYLQHNFHDDLLWICMFRQPETITDYNWCMLQYSHWGEVDGITGDVDLDVFNGDQMAWERWLHTLK